MRVCSKENRIVADRLNTGHVSLVMDTEYATIVLRGHSK